MRVVVRDRSAFQKGYAVIEIPAAGMIEDLHDSSGE
jgi:hypothetical protein